jgi:hypothetical protein
LEKSKTLNICTIITPDYLYKALALLASMVKFQRVHLHVLVSETKDRLNPFRKHISYLESPVEIYTLDEIYDMESLTRLLHYKKDMVRWSSKSLFLCYLLMERNFESVIYLDNDICFFNDFRFLFDELNENGVLLTPHWRTLDPELNEHQFLCNFRDGMFNAGFVGSGKRGLEALRWWHKACLYRCEFDFENGLYVDQKYLDALPLYFKDVKSVRHFGCNIAQWNADYLTREIKNGEVLIYGKWPIVFIHFSPVTIQNIQYGNDLMLQPHLELHQTYIERARRDIQTLSMELRSAPFPSSKQIL